MKAYITDVIQDSHSKETPLEHVKRTTPGVGLLQYVQVLYILYILVETVELCLWLAHNIYRKLICMYCICIH